MFLNVAEPSYVFSESKIAKKQEKKDKRKQRKKETTSGPLTGGNDVNIGMLFILNKVMFYHQWLFRILWRVLYHHV